VQYGLSEEVREKGETYLHYANWVREGDRQRFVDSFKRRGNNEKSIVSKSPRKVPWHWGNYTPQGWGNLPVNKWRMGGVGGVICGEAKTGPLLCEAKKKSFVKDLVGERSGAQGKVQRG